MQGLTKRKWISSVTPSLIVRVLTSSPVNLLPRRATGVAIFAFLLFTLHAPSVAKAQSDSSSLSGTVTDPSGAVVPNARVTARNEATGLQRTVANQRHRSLHHYESSVRQLYRARRGEGLWRPSQQKGTHLDPNIGSRYDASLKTGQSSTTITVQADANTLQTESAAVGQLVTSEQVNTIQLNGRNPIYLSQLEPGVARNAPLSSFNFSPDFTGPYHQWRAQQ